jgi:hypothetical protein
MEINMVLAAEAQKLATAACGVVVSLRKQHGIWYVQLPEKARRATIVQMFEAAGVVVLADIRQG